MPTFSFDVSDDLPEVRTPKSFEPIPSGSYHAMIIDSAMKVTKKGDGEYLQLTFQIADGEHSGRRIWVNLNVSNPNKTAEEIAQKELNAICKAAGIKSGSKLRETEQLHDVLMNIGVDLDRKDQTRNRIVSYSQTGQATPTASPATNKKPWEK